MIAAPGDSEFKVSGRHVGYAQRVPGTGEFSVATAAALVLGGLCAIALAVAVTISKSEPRMAGAGVASARTSVALPPSPSAERAEAEPEVEYQLDPSDP